MVILTPEEKAALEAYGAAVADKIEATDLNTLEFHATENAGPLELLKVAAHERARALADLASAEGRIEAVIPALRESGMSWHKLSTYLGLTPEAVRLRYSRVNQ